MVLHDLNLLDALTAAFPAGSLHAVAIKANPLVEVLRRCVERGVGLEAASWEEVALAVAAGCEPSRIDYDSPAKTRTEIARALELGRTRQRRQPRRARPDHRPPSRLPRLDGDRRPPGQPRRRRRLDPHATGGCPPCSATATGPSGPELSVLRAREGAADVVRLRSRTSADRPASGAG